MAMEITTIKVALKGIRPLMFDRYAGDNNTSLPPEEKMYLNDQKQLIIPAINVYSLLISENNKSVVKQFFASKTQKDIRLGISSYTNIEPFDIPIMDDSGPIVFRGWNDQISVKKDVARLNKGIPNPKIRPVLALPWKISFVVQYQDNKNCTFENLRQAFTMGGVLGLGTFRPFFGRYELVGWEY